MTDEPTTMDPDEAFHSHTWYDIDGEAHCRICMTHWDTDLAEQQCSGEGMSRADCLLFSTAHERRPHITVDDIEWVIAQRAAGAEWRVITDELDRHVSGLQRAMSDYHAYRGRIGKARAERERGAA